MRNYIIIAAIAAANISAGGYYANDTTSTTTTHDASRLKGTFKTEQDRQIAERIRDEIGPGWVTKGYEHVTYDVIDGRVVLRGSVKTAEEKKDVEDSVRKLSGVKSIDNQLTIAKSGDAYQSVRYQSNLNNGIADTSDEAIRNNNLPNGERSSVLHDRADANRNSSLFDRDETNTTRDGDLHNGDKAHSSYYDNSNVKANASKFPQDAAASDQDRLINSRIRDKISNGWFTTSYENLTLRTNNGVVTLEGIVERQNEINDLGNSVQKVDGVQRVNNLLKAKQQ